MGGPLSRRLGGWGKPLVVGAAAAAVLLAVAPPLVAVSAELLTSGASLAWLGQGRLWWLLGRSLALAAAVTALALGAGVPLGVLFARGAFPAKPLLFGLHVGPALLTPFFPALGWFHLLGAEGWLGSAATARALFSGAGVALVLAACFTPLVTALTALGVRGVDASLEEAARLVGGPWRAAALVLVPCAAPAIALAGVVTFALAFSELGVPMLLRLDVYPAVVFSRLGGLDFAPGEAAALALPLVLVAGGLLTVERRFAGRRAIAALGGRGEAREPLFGARLPLLGVALAAALLSTAPLVALVAHGVRGAAPLELERWLGEAPWNSLRGAGLAAAAMTGVAVVLGSSLARAERGARWLDALSTLAFVLPSSVLGMGLITAWNRPGTGWVYTSAAILVLGWVARYGVVATRAFASAVAQLPPSLDEAARSMGAGYLARLGLTAGLARRGLAGAFVLALCFSLRDLEMAALFYPPGGEPLPVRIFTLEANGPPAVVSALAVLHVVLTLAAAGLAWLALRPERRR